MVTNRESDSVSGIDIIWV